MRSSFLLLFFLISAFQRLIAQEGSSPIVEFARLGFAAKQVIPPSPDAASLGKYGNIPVSLFTGTPSISIPLLEMKGSMLSLPVSLSYNAGGFKPEEIASWVGLGWSLNAGGVITRSVQGNPDVTGNYFTSPSPFAAPSSSNIFGTIDYYEDIRTGAKETQPDIYYYNFMGHTGKFTVQPNGQVYQKEKSMLVISSCNACSSFTITDEQGTQYVFSALENTFMIPSDEEGNPSYNFYDFNSSWYLSSVISRNASESIVFEYYTAAEEQIMYSNRINNQSSSYTVTSSACNILSQLIPVIEKNEFIPYDSRIRNRKFLKRASFYRAEEVLFYIDFESVSDERQDLWLADFSGERMLKKIKMYASYNSAPELVKEWDLTQSYFGNPADPATRRLRLDNVQEISLQPSTPDVPPYVFEYNNNDIPERFTSGIDHWGFYNGSSNLSGGTKNLVPNVTLSGQNFPDGVYGLGANRNANFVGSVTALLSKITHPTRGYTVFEFEQNTGIGNDNNLYTVGGVRIKTITDYSQDNQVAGIKKYSYLLPDQTTSGRVGNPPRYYDINLYNYYTIGCAVGGGCSPGANISCFNYSKKTLTISANSLFGLGTIQGSHVGYTMVTESQSDPNGQILGKTVYHYNIGVIAEYDDDIRNGDLIKKEVYSTGRLLSEEINTYGYTSLEDITIRKLRSEYDQNNRKLLCKEANGEYNYYSYQETHPSCVESRVVETRYSSDLYSIVCQQKRLLEQVSRVYDQLSNTYLTQTKKYTYDNPDHIYPTKTEQNTTASEKLVTTIKYAGDYIFPSVVTTDIAYNGIKQLRNKNMTGVPIEKMQYRENSDGSNRRYVNGSISIYQDFNPVSLLELELASPVAGITGSSFDAAGTFLYSNLYRPSGNLKYDLYGNITEQTKANDLTKAYLWDYKKLYPSAEVINASADRALYTSFETASTGGWVLNAGSTYNTNNVITGQRTCSGGLSATIPSGNYIVSLWATGTPLVNGSGISYSRISPINNNWKYYEWRLSNVTAITVSASEMDEVRLYPQQAQMVTYTYNTGMDLNGQADNNSLPIYYEYDGLSRLLNIKDDKANIIKNYRYNYGSATGSSITPSAATLFYNAPASGSFSKANCPALAVTSAVIYQVPYGRYVSAVNQAAANAQAAADIAANGQAYADANGICIWYNDTKNGVFVKNNCLPEQGVGNNYNYFVPAGTYSSLISKADANQKAIDDVAANGQQRANTNGTCSCASEGKRYINGVCTTGVKFYEGSTYLGAGLGYRCRYIYVFSDGFHSPDYFEYRSTPCPQNP